VFTAGSVPQWDVAHEAVLPSGARVAIPPPDVTEVPPAPPAAPSAPTQVDVTAFRVPLGTVVGARSGDKGGDANVGVWARNPRAYEWLCGYLTADELRKLLPETADLEIDRYELRNLRALNFVIHGLPGAGVAASTRFDPQAKALGEWLRARLVDIPVALGDTP
jgi:hypothetical protein